MADENMNQQDANQSDASQGRAAEKPREIPAPGWKSILKRTKHDIQHDHLTTVSAGVGLFFLLGLVPGLAALISIYGLVSDPAQIQQQFASLQNLLPGEVSQILLKQMKSISASSSTASWSAVVSILISLWGGSKGIKALIDGLNIAYHENEKRGFFKLNLTALALTIAGIFALCIIVGLLAAVPAVLGSFHLGPTGRQVVMALRWPALFVFFMIALAVLYRYGPSRDEPKWRWVSWGAFTAAASWLAVSGAFAVFLSYFNSYNKTYGSLGAIVVLLVWLQWSAYSVLVGAELNAEMERQTAKDTTKGARQPQGWRGAFAADNPGESRT